MINKKSQVGPSRHQHFAIFLEKWMLQSKAAWKWTRGTTQDSSAGSHFFPALYFRNVSHNRKRGNKEQMESVKTAIENNGAKTFLGGKNLIKIVSHSLWQSEWENRWRAEIKIQLLWYGPLKMTETWLKKLRRVCQLLEVPCGVSP